jgi:hypothetical protein
MMGGMLPSVSLANFPLNRSFSANAIGPNLPVSAVTAEQCLCGAE